MNPVAQPANRLAASFRDPSGFLFTRSGVLYRQVNDAYRNHYDQLLSSGLYQRLLDKGLIVGHEEVEISPETPEGAYKVIRPERLSFISYPYEWSFSQLQDAAQTTLEIQKMALAEGMSLKDASAYNIQFRHGRPLLIDTLSFEQYPTGAPWVAYRQFCQHFLAPLSLMAYRDIRLGQLLRSYVDGIPLDLASRLLPWRTRLSFGLLTHIHLHAQAQQRYADKMVDKTAVRRQMSQTQLLGLIDSLYTTIGKLRWRAAGTEWADYETDNNYSSVALVHKEKLVAQFIEQIRPQTLWDLGANTGRFSRLASRQGIDTIAFDIDPAAVELNYLRLRQEKEHHLLPLLLDLTNPSPAIGWHNQERDSFIDRAPAEATLALALIHHLAIANNVPLNRLAHFFANLSPWLIIEFVPKSDSQVRRLLATREDIFPEYDPAGFEAAFAPQFDILEKRAIDDSERSLYLLHRRGER